VGDRLLHRADPARASPGDELTGPPVEGRPPRRSEPLLELGAEEWMTERHAFSGELGQDPGEERHA